MKMHERAGHLDPDGSVEVTELPQDKDTVKTGKMYIPSPEDTALARSPITVPKNTATRLPVDAVERKSVPIATGFVDYFPDAMAAVAALSQVGNDQHHKGMPLHWDRSKSTDEADALMRHFVERGTLDVDGIRHSAKVAWRAMALLQKEIEAGLFQ
jgi:hypothetical protein